MRRDLSAYRKTLNGVLYAKLHPCRRGAAKRGLPYDLTVSYMVEVYNSQKGRCALTGRELPLEINPADPWGALSVDRMTRDIREKLAMFANTPITVVRIGLNMDQIDELKPPANYLKVRADGEFADSRAKEYYRQFGEESWELEVLRPQYIHDLIEKNVLQIRDPELWDEALQEETNDKRRLEELVAQFGGAPEEQDDDD